MSKIYVPHGQFKRRFTHKRKRLLGMRTQVFDALEREWIYVGELITDHAIDHIIANLPSSKEYYPSRPVTESYVTHGQQSWEVEAMARSEQTHQEQREYQRDRVEHETLDRTRSHAVASEPAQFGGFESPSVSSSESRLDTDTSSRSSYDSGSSFGSSSSSSDSGFSCGGFD